MPDLGHTFWELIVVLGKLVVQLLALALSSSLLIVWIAWWLWGVNWKKAWPTLATGGWAPLVLLALIAAAVWSRLSPSETLNFWTQLASVSALIGVAFFCGWLQGVFGWTPPEINLLTAGAKSRRPSWASSLNAIRSRRFAEAWRQSSTLLQSVAKQATPHGPSHGGMSGRETLVGAPRPLGGGCVLTPQSAWALRAALVA